MTRRTFGKMCGAAGAVVLVGCVFIWFLVGSWTLAGIQAGVGLTLLGIFFATNWAHMGQFTSKKGTSFFFSSAAMTLALLVAIAAVNFIVSRKNKTWDFTAKQIHSLSPQTHSAIKGLSEKVTVIGFLPAKDPAYGQLKMIFQRYQDVQPDKLEFTFKDPMEHPDLAQKYSLKEGQATVVLTRGEGEKQQQTSLNIVSEQELTNALLKLNSADESQVCFVVGHGEHPLQPVDDQSGRGMVSVAELARSLKQEGYASRSLNLTGITEVPRDCALLLIAGARGPYTEPEVKLVEQYLDEGGRVAFFANHGEEPGLGPVLTKYGVQVDPGLVADAEANPKSPYNIVTPYFSDHEIGTLLKGLQMNIQMPSTRGLSVLHSGQAEGVLTAPVLTTSPSAWVESTPENRPQPDSGEKMGQIPLVVASTRPTASAPNKRFDQARLIVFGDSDLILDRAWGNEPNRNFVMNALAWTTSQVAKVTIRPPDRDISTVDIDDRTMRLIRYCSLVLAPMSVLIVGLAIWISRRNK